MIAAEAHVSSFRVLAIILGPVNQCDCLRVLCKGQPRCTYMYLCLVDHTAEKV